MVDTHVTIHATMRESFSMHVRMCSSDIQLSPPPPPSSAAHGRKELFVLVSQEQSKGAGRGIIYSIAISLQDHTEPACACGRRSREGTDTHIT